MANNLAAYFANQSNDSWSLKANSAPAMPMSSSNGSNGHKSFASQSDDDMGPSVSMAVRADDDDSFRKSTFNLKRTRSMGLLDEYIDPTRKLLEKDDPGLSTGSRNNLMRCRTEDDQSRHLERQPEGLPAEEEEKGRVQEPKDNDEYLEDSKSVSPPSADADSMLLPQDDNDLVREPKRHVDYLSHEWNESDISNSWKYIILKKKKGAPEDQVNAARLENASWRTWAKARNHLKTVSPEVVNWSKDSDVTWLYGPIVRANEGNDVEMGYGSDDQKSKRVGVPRNKKKKGGVSPKPILKKRTVEEILEENSLWKLSQARKHRNEMRHVSSVMDANGSMYDPHDDYDDYDALAAKVNAQYYGSPKSKNQSNKTENWQTVPNLAGGGKDAVPQGSKQDFPSPAHSSPQASSNRYDRALKTILTSSNDNGTDSKPSKVIRDRHIHFNDRVEQCMAISNPGSDADLIGNGAQQSDEEPGDSYGSGNIISGRSRDSAQASEDSGSDRFSSDDEEADDEDNSGLFINPSIRRRSDSATHSLITDNSSTGSFKVSKLSLHPIIKLLPATTLNYGSEDEASGNSDYNGYGSSVSHNVNTYRGYDYMYDYNSVYTGDTSSFLPVENCDIVDVPEGIGLHSAIADDNASTYEFNQAALSDHSNKPRADEKQVEESKNFNKDEHDHSFLRDDSDNSGSERDEQFIENTQYPSSDDEDDDLRLRRETSIGKASSIHSFKDLSHGSSSSAPKASPRACSFISGKPLDSMLNYPASTSKFNDVNDRGTANEHTNHNVNDTNNNDDNNSNNSSSSNNSGAGRSRSPRSLKRATSSSFIFNSESDDDEDEDILEDYDRSRAGKFVSGENNPSSKKDVASQLSFKSRSRTGPPQSSVILPTTATKSAIASRPQSSDLSKSIRIKNSLSSAEVGSSDVAITGSFSPINGSAKSAVSNKGIYHKGPSTHELREVDKNLQEYHIDENRSAGVTHHRDSSESVHKMMQNARDIANKYLHPWKKGEGHSHSTKLDNKSSRND